MMNRKRGKIILAVLFCTGLAIFRGDYGALKTVGENLVKTIGVAENNEIPDIYYNSLLNFDTQEKQYYYSFIELENYEYPILLLSDGIYKDNQSYVAMWTDVYYYVNGEVTDFGNLLSGGTAYPIAADKSGIFTASGHGVEKYNLNIEGHTLRLTESSMEYFNSVGEVTYISKEDNQNSRIITAKEFDERYKKYTDAKVVTFRELMIK